MFVTEKIWPAALLQRFVGPTIGDVVVTQQLFWIVIETASLMVTQPAVSEAVRVYTVAAAGHTCGVRVVSAPGCIPVVGDQMMSGVYSSISSSNVIDQPSKVPEPVSAVVATSMDQRPLAVQPSTPVNGCEELKVPVME